MMKLPIRTWIRNAGAVFCGHHGSVSEQAEAEGCSRQTVYDHAHKVEERLAERDREIADLRGEIARLKTERDELQKRLEQSTVIDKEALRRFAIVGQAMGISLRQTEELLETLLPKNRVPDHATMGRWAQAAGQRAGEVLAALDPLCAKAVETLCIDEIFFWESSDVSGGGADEPGTAGMRQDGRPFRCGVAAGVAAVREPGVRPVGCGERDRQGRAKRSGRRERDGR